MATTQGMFTSSMWKTILNTPNAHSRTRQTHILERPKQALSKAHSLTRQTHIFKCTEHALSIVPSTPSNALNTHSHKHQTHTVECTSGKPLNAPSVHSWTLQTLSWMLFQHMVFTLEAQEGAASFFLLSTDALLSQSRWALWRCLCGWVGSWYEEIPKILFPHCRAKHQIYFRVYFCKYSLCVGSFKVCR